MAEKKTPKRTFRKTDYSLPAELFVSTWERLPTLDGVYEALKAHSEKAGKPVMPKRIIAARAAEYRSAGIPLKIMPRVSPRNIDAKAMTELVEKVRAGVPAPAPQTLAPKAVPAKPGRGLTREEVEEVVVEVLRRHGLVK